MNRPPLIPSISVILTCCRNAVFLISVLLASCGGGGESESNNPVSTQTVVSPNAAPVNSNSAVNYLNDTGINASQCYQADSFELVACNSAAAMALSSAQDGMVGRDVDAANDANAGGQLGFNFAKVMGDCVVDNVTGLMWEGKTSGTGVRDGGSVYTHYRPTDNPPYYGTSQDVSGFVTEVNASNLCGYNDWRLPTIDELQSIVDYSVASPGPTLDASWFPNTAQRDYWSDTTHSVSFTQGSIAASDHIDWLAVRLVRTHLPVEISSQAYVISADGTEVSDHQTGLIWRRCSEGMAWDSPTSTCSGTASVATHNAALRLARAQAGNTGKAWRLPNVKELYSISKVAFSNASTLFPATPADKFWSATPKVGGIHGNAWFVSPAYVSDQGREVAYHVRLVRSGQ